MYGADATENDAYVKMINQKHFDRVTGLIDPEKVVFGGGWNERTMQIQPTILDDVTAEDAVMQEEIFGPILPVIGYTDIDQAIKMVKERNKPLACYIFTEQKAYADKINAEVSFGGGCINDVIMHVSNHHMPFGGVGNSGMGGYHGKYSFDTFSHTKSVVKSYTAFDVPLRYAPFTEEKLAFLKKFL